MVPYFRIWSLSTYPCIKKLWGQIFYGLRQVVMPLAISRCVFDFDLTRKYTICVFYFEANFLKNILDKVILFKSISFFKFCVFFWPVKSF